MIQQLHRNTRDLTGQRFGRLVVISATERRNKRRQIFWQCQCDCGNTHEVTGSNLLSGSVTSCGCFQREVIAKIGRGAKGKLVKGLIGRRFGRLVVLQSTERRSHRNALWECQCDCGNLVYVTGHSLMVGSTRSCGCLQKEIAPNNLPRDMKGENHPRWKSTTPENERRRNQKEYGEWRLFVFRRDGFKCCKCGDARGGNLIAHHIENFSEHMDQQILPDNGITFCKTCHKKFHDSFGYARNNRKQLENFLTGE